MKKKTHILIITIIVSLVFYEIIKINIINTKALSPIGNTEENYNKIINEFGEEFEEFIKDDSYIKIYNKEEEDVITVKAGETNIYIKKSNKITEKVKEYYGYLTIGYKVVKDDLGNKIESFKVNRKENKEEEETINVNSTIEEKDSKKIDKIVDDFMKNKE